MFTVTKDAARQIKISATHNQSENMVLRIAATKNTDNSIHYGMGFDEKKDEDTSTLSEGIEIVIAANSIEILKNTTLDYVELEPGKLQFIFINPDDPSNSPSEPG